MSSQVQTADWSRTSHSLLSSGPQDLRPDKPASNPTPDLQPLRQSQPLCCNPAEEPLDCYTQPSFLKGHFNVSMTSLPSPTVLLTIGPTGVFKHRKQETQHHYVWTGSFDAWMHGDKWKLFWIRGLGANVTAGFFRMFVTRN